LTSSGKALRTSAVARWISSSSATRRSGCSLTHAFRPSSFLAISRPTRRGTDLGCVDHRGQPPLADMCGGVSQHEGEPHWGLVPEPVGVLPHRRASPHVSEPAEPASPTPTPMPPKDGEGSSAAGNRMRADLSDQEDSRRDRHRARTLRFPATRSLRPPRYCPRWRRLRSRSVPVERKRRSLEPFRADVRRDAQVADSIRRLR
jgi:hypothetical protein